MHKSETHFKVWSLLLHVSACLCQIQGVHTLDLKLAGI